MMKTVGRPETLFKQNFKKRKYDASDDRFCNSFTNHWSLSIFMLHHKVLLHLC